MGLLRKRAKPFQPPKPGEPPVVLPAAIPPLPFVVRYAHPRRHPRTGIIKAHTLADAQALAAASVVGTSWTVGSVTAYTPAHD